MRIAIIGANGQLGTDLCRSLPGTVTGLQRPEVDVTLPKTIEAALERAHPDVVINCAAMTHVDGCEQAAEDAFRANAIGAFNVARVVRARGGARLIHISTDYVFGTAGRTEPWVESDAPNPTCVYGISKLAGEQLVRANCDRWCIVRASGLYGHAGARGKGGNFVETMLRLAREGRPVRVVNDQRLSPTSTRRFASRLASLLEQTPAGVVHLAASDHCTWFEFARAIFETERITVDLNPISTAEYGAPASRPAFSALASGRLTEFNLESCGPWREMLSEYLKQRSGTAA